ncbi:MAG TPA: hypothetical protein VFA41_11965 [Ktedonobacteraceae bacterium]|nr:hypothetical protein [Ktedonobacteraceae bacterium]
MSEPIYERLHTAITEKYAQLQQALGLSDATASKKATPVSDDYVAWLMTRLGRLFLQAKEYLPGDELLQLLKQLSIPALRYEAWIQTAIEDFAKGITYPFDEPREDSKSA